MPVMSAVAGVPWNLHARWSKKYWRAVGLSKRPWIPRRLVKKWTSVARKLRRKYPYVDKPLRYSVYFERILSKPGFKKDIRELEEFAEKFQKELEDYVVSCGIPRDFYSGPLGVPYEPKPRAGQPGELLGWDPA